MRALDAAGNVSAFSNSDTASVFPPDTEAPTKPGNLHASGSGNGNVALTWNASLDNVGVTAYRVYRGTAEIASLNGDTTSFTDTGRPPGNYSYTVRAEDQAGNASDPSDPASATVPDVEKPSKPGNLTATPAGAGQVDLSWQASSDNVLVTGYKVYRGTQEIASLGPDDLVQRHRPAARHLQLHGEGHGRRREPLRCQQRGKRDRARLVGPDGADPAWRHGRELHPDRPELAGLQR